MRNRYLLWVRFREASVAWHIRSPGMRGSDDQKVVELRLLAEQGVSEPKQGLIAGIVEDPAGRPG